MLLSADLLFAYLVISRLSFIYTVHVILMFSADHVFILPLM